MSITNRFMQVLAKRRQGGSAVPWWLSGGVDAGDVLAAYAAVGASDIGTSFVNLANPGTYNLTGGTSPAFDSATGWLFGGGGYKDTGIIPNDHSSGGFSVICRYYDPSLAATGNYLLGSYQTTSPVKSIYLVPRAGGTSLSNGVNGSITGATVSASGFLAVSGNKGYINAEEVTLSGTLGWPTVQTTIGCNNFNGSTPSDYYTGYIYSVAFYTANLTAGQIAAIGAAMPQP